MPWWSRWIDRWILDCASKCFCCVRVILFFRNKLSVCACSSSLIILSLVVWCFPCSNKIVEYDRNMIGICCKSIFLKTKLHFFEKNDATKQTWFTHSCLFAVFVFKIHIPIFNMFPILDNSVSLSISAKEILLVNWWEKTAVTFWSCWIYPSPRVVYH